jgi:hypothetical protein
MVLSGLAMRELRTGFLMLLACGAFYVQIDPSIWNRFSQIFALFLGQIDRL